MKVRVAASSANLGPGFDCIGLALGRYDEIDAEITAGGLEVSVDGEGADSVPLDDRHLVVRSVQLGLDAWGVPMPGLRLLTRNSIPHSRGLGSSAAAIVGGLAVAWGIAFGTRELDRAELLRLATLAEGHPDNAGAAVFGGALLAWFPRSGGVQMTPIDLHPEIAFRVYIPDFRTPTAAAREVLPTTIPLSDAVLQASRAALLVKALTTAPEHLLAATEDRLHQACRADLMRPSWELMMQLRKMGIPAVISGAGPTVLALGTPEELAEDLCPAGFTVQNLPVGRGVELLY